MEELRLPPNSNVRKGTTYKHSWEAVKLRNISIYRYDPNSEENPRIDIYELDLCKTGSMVLDALIKIKMK